MTLAMEGSDATFTAWQRGNLAHAAELQGRGRSDVTATQPRDREVRSDDAVLHLVARGGQGCQGLFEVLVCPLGGTEVQLADTLAVGGGIVSGLEGDAAGEQVGLRAQHAQAFPQRLGVRSRRHTSTIGASSSCSRTNGTLPI
jgi:hypothetical protein